MSEQIKKIFGFIIVFIILFVFLDRGIDWWSEKKIISENDKRITFAIENKNPQICSIVNNAISMANTVTNKDALDRYKKIAQEHYCDEASNERIKNSLGYKLVIIEDKNKDLLVSDPRISAINGKLNLINKQTGIPETSIADMAHYIEKTIQDKGVESQIDDVLEVFSVAVENKACTLHSEQTIECFSSFLARYAMIRLNTDQNHQTAISSLRSILDVINDPEKMAKLKELANSEN
jgi:hypothetical protein